MGKPAFEIKKQPAVLTRDKAWLLGHLAGDGGFVYRPDLRKHAVTVYAGLDRDVVEECSRLFKEIYGAETQIKTRGPGKGKRKNVSYETTCYKRAVVEDLMSCGTFGLTTWRVPDAVLRGSDEIKASWLSGMFDADGSMYFRPEKSVRTINLTSINEPGLRQASALLTILGIRHGWSDRKHNKEDCVKWMDSHAIYLTYHNDLRSFSRLIKFRSPRKQEKLEAALSSYERQVMRTEDVVKHLPEVKRRREAGETHAKIAKDLRLVREVVAELCYRNEIEPKGREGNAAGGTRSVGFGAEEGKLQDVLALRAQGVPLKEIAIRLGFKDQEQGVQGLLQRAVRKGKIKPLGRSTKNKDVVPRIIAMRAEGKKWREIGRALGYEGTDHEVAVRTAGVQQWAKKKGLWPLTP
jgi:intein/homing endonuclease